MYLVLLITVTLLAFHIDVIDGAEDYPIFRPDYTYVPSTKSFYKYHANARPWKTAKETCESEKTSLFVFTDAQEVDVVKRFTNVTSEPRWSWVGVHTFEETPRTIDGHSVGSDLWFKDEPNNVNGAEHCAVVMEDANNKLNDYHCNALMPFLCKLTLQAYQNSPTLQDYELNVPAQDYNYMLEDRLIEIPTCKGQYYLPSKRSFYKYHNKEAVSWDEAKRKCDSENAKLFFAEDEDEASKVVAISNHMYWHQWIWTGIHYLDSGFKTVDGRLVDDVFINWFPKEPNSRGCVFLMKDGSFKDESCSKKFDYICKKSYPQPFKFECN